jgi:hypothetical protein
MRHDPLFLSWSVRCESPEVASRLQQWLRGQIAPDAVFEDIVRPAADGVAAASAQRHQLGDYFEAVHLLPGRPDMPSSFRVLFHRRPDAGRYWKDVMVRVLQAIRQAAEGTVTILDFQGDEQPEPIERRS